MVRGQATEFKYERGVQPAPKLGEWVEDLTEILDREAKLPRRERRSTQRLFEELRCGRGSLLCTPTWISQFRIHGVGVGRETGVTVVSDFRSRRL